MENTIAVVAIIVEDPESVRALNETLHEYSSYIIGRMGIPYRQKNISLISVALDAPKDVVNALKRRLVEHDGVRAEIVEA